MLVLDELKPEIKAKIENDSTIKDYMIGSAREGLALCLLRYMTTSITAPHLCQFWSGHNSSGILVTFILFLGINSFKSVT